MRVTDVFLAFPFLVALLVMRNMLGEIAWLEPIIGERTSIRFIILLLALFGWMGVARVVRGQVLALKEREFIEASRALGATNRRIIVRHLLPNSIGPILVAHDVLGRRRRDRRVDARRSSGSVRSPAPARRRSGILVGGVEARTCSPATGGWSCSRARRCCSSP